MKPKNVEIPSLYEEKQFKKMGVKINKVYFIGVLVLLLVVFRLINLAMWEVMTRLELANKPQDPQVKYTFLHLSSYAKADAQARELSLKPGAPPVTVVSYFNLLHPGVFLVRNQAAFAAVNLGRVVIPLKAGSFNFKIHLSGAIEYHIEYQDEHSRGHFRTEKSLLLDFVTKKDPAADKNISFILQPRGKLKYLEIPYHIYFYLPLAVILIFFGVFSRAVLAAFFYYPGLFLLFDFKVLFLKMPFSWLMPALGIEPGTPGESLIAVGAVVLFTLIGFWGLLYWRKTQDLFKERLVVLFFILLPLFLRF
jgi:hypothetical protein